MGKSIIIKGADYSANGILPEFVRLSWIGLSDSNGSFEETPYGRFISSGVNVTSEVKMIMTFQTDNTPHSVMLSGSRYSVGSTFQIWLQGERVVAYFGMYDNTTNSELIQRNLWDGNIHTVELSKSGIVVDGDEYLWTNPVPTASWNVPIYLDCSSQQPAQGGYYNSYAHDEVEEGVYVPCPESVKIKNVKIYTDYQSPASIVVDAIPVKRTADNVVCFYNTVNAGYLQRNDGSEPEYGTL